MWKSWGISVNFLKCNKHTVGKVFLKSPHVIEIHSKYSRATWHDIQDLHQDNSVCIWGIRYIQNYIKIWIIFNYIKTWVHRSSFLFFSGCSMQESLFPDQESNLRPLQWKCRALTIGPPGKSLFFFLFPFYYSSLYCCVCLNFL